MKKKSGLAEIGAAVVAAIFLILAVLLGRKGEN